MEKIKVIEITHCSHSYFFGNGTENMDDILRGSWSTQVSMEIKRFYPEIEVECWFPEKIEKREREFEYKKIRMRIFPATFSPMYALDYSWPMLKALKKEIEDSKNNNKKLNLHIHEYHNLHGVLISYMFRKEKMIAQHHGGSWPLKHLKQTKRYRLFFPFFMFGQILENIFLRNIKHFFVLSLEEMDYLKKIAPKSKVEFQTMGIEEAYFKKIDKKTAREKLNIPLNDKVILYIGRINEVKGIRYLLDAMEDLKDIKLKIIGFSQNIEKFKQYALDKKLNNVEFLGGVFGEKKMLYLSSADALILPSLKEGAPVTVMEALSRNTPVVVTNVGGVGLMIEDKREGIMIKQRDSKDIVRGIREILKWKNKNIKKYAEKYRWKKIVDETVKDYFEI